MKTKAVLFISLAIMGGLIIFAAFFTDLFLSMLNQPALYVHARFVHIGAVTLFFANALLGMIWESRALASGRKQAILHTYETVAWLDARLSSPLIILSLVAGLMLAVIRGAFMETGWLFWSFSLFILSGVIWVISDIPTQYRLKRLLAGLEPGQTDLPDGLIRLLKLRWWISLAGVVPLVIVFVFMVYQPDLPALAGLHR